MVRRSLIVAALLAVSSPLAAQDEGWMWTSDRPDGEAPAGIMGARTLSAGALEIEYQWVQRNYQGVWVGTDSLDVLTTLSLYEVAPLTLSDRRHTVEVGYGVTDELTLRARGQFAMMEREQIRFDGIFYITSASALGDLQVDATYNVLRMGAYRMDVNAGAIIPLGKARTYAESPYSTPADEATSYDMRPGAGSFGYTGAASFDMQNEVGSFGAQFRILGYINENSVDFTLGNRYEANGWAAYAFNESFSVSAGIRWEKWGNIDGGDPDLAAAVMRDPMNQGVFLSGIRAGMPLGINFVFPEGTTLGGHRISFETYYALHHDYSGPQIGLDWGINLGYSAPLPM